MLTRTDTRSQVLPFYKDINGQYHRWSECGDCTPMLISVTSPIPPFQIIVASDSVVINSATLIELDNPANQENLILNETAFVDDFNGDGSQQTAIWTDGNVTGTVAIGTPVYLVLALSNGETLYSEVFCRSSELAKWDYRLEWSNSCDWSNFYYAGGYLNALDLDIQFKRPDYANDEKGTEDGFGKFTPTFIKQNKKYSFDLIVADPMLDALQLMQHHDQVVLKKRDGILFPDEYDIGEIELNVQGNVNDCEHLVTVEFEIIEEEFITTGACGSLYENAPYEECNEDGDGTGGTSDCGGRGLSITITDDLATATPTNLQPGDIPTYQWYFTPYAGGATVSLGSSTSVNMSESGSYQVVMTVGSCVLQDSHTYFTACEFWNFQFVQDGVLLTAIPNGVVSSPIFEWTYIDPFFFTETPLPDTTNQITMGAFGLYRLKMYNAGEVCTFTDTYDYDETTNSAVAITITRDGDLLTAETLVCTNPTYTWYVDRADGNGLIQLPDTTQTITISGSGNYAVSVSCDEADGYAEYLYIECNDECGEITVEVTVTEGEAESTVTGCAGLTEYAYFRNAGNGFNQVGSSQDLTLPGDGLYRLQVTCDGCVKSKDFLYCSGSSDCVRVNLTPIGYIPAASGNASNLNEIVIASDNTTWFIGTDGNAIRLTRSAGDFEVTTTSNGVIMKSPDGTRWRVMVDDEGQHMVEQL